MCGKCFILKRMLDKENIDYTYSEDDKDLEEAGKRLSQEGYLPSLPIIKYNGSYYNNVSIDNIRKLIKK